MRQKTVVLELLNNAAWTIWWCLTNERSKNLVVGDLMSKQFISTNIMHFTVWKDLRCSFFWRWVVFLTVFCQAADVSLTHVYYAQCQCDFWCKRRSHDDHRNPYCFWYLLCWLWIHRWMEICKICKGYFIVSFVYCLASKLLWCSSLGGCTWEEPAIQGRKVYSGEVMAATFCRGFVGLDLPFRKKCPLFKQICDSVCKMQHWL